MSDALKKQDEFSTLPQVHEAFVGWESEKQVEEFGMALWGTAKNLVRAESEYKESSEGFVDAVFLKLYRNGSLTACLTDGFRRLIVRYHAQNMRTVDAVEAILLDETYRQITPFYLFRHSNVCGFQNIKDFLVGRLGYLKQPHPRFPKKYADLYREERKNYIDSIQDIPLVQPVERVQKLSEHYEELEVLFRNAESPSEKERYHKCMMRTLAGIDLMTREPAHKAMPEQLTTEKQSPALPKPEQDDVIDVAVEVVAAKKEKSQ